MGFFDTSGATRRDAMGFLDKAMSQFNPSTFMQDFDSLFGTYSQAANQMGQAQRLAGTMGARAAQAGISRLLGPGSGMNAGEGFRLGANFGVAGGLRAQAIQDAMNAALGLAGNRASVNMQQANAVLQTPRKSGWGVYQDVTQHAASMASAFGGNPFASTGQQSAAPPSSGGTNIDPNNYSLDFQVGRR